MEVSICTYERTEDNAHSARSDTAYTDESNRYVSVKVSLVEGKMYAR